MLTVNKFIKYCFAGTKVTHISAFKYPPMPKKDYNVDGERIRRHLQVVGVTTTWCIQETPNIAKQD